MVPFVLNLKVVSVDLVFDGTVLVTDPRFIRVYSDASISQGVAANFYCSATALAAAFSLV
tara:strand:+ start:603 stop:782 length:180 start_codon:yes stop_codon:yes gene_type:complete